MTVEELISVLEKIDKDRLVAIGFIGKKIIWRMSLTKENIIEGQDSITFYGMIDNIELDDVEITAEGD